MGRSFAHALAVQILSIFLMSNHSLAEIYNGIGFMAVRPAPNPGRQNERRTEFAEEIDMRCFHWKGKHRAPVLGRRLFACVAWFMAVMVIPVAHAQPVAAGDLAELSLEDLMAIEITTLSRKVQGMADTAAAVFVITQEDIRRSGATSIPEALRMVPGIQVARISADKWAITSRGFNDWFSNKLLVLMDGRSVYNTIFSGVYWRAQDTLLEDVARIEVIRGPGASLWGANAVNGVINIVTRSADQAQGGLLTAGAGNEERGFGAFRYGGALGESAHYTAHVKHTDRDGSVDADGHDLDDTWHITEGGGRLDWSGAAKDGVTLMGGYYDGESQVNAFTLAADPPYYSRYHSDERYKGYHVLGRWQRTFSRSSEMILQLYYDRTEMDSDAIYSERTDTYDLDFQHRFGWGGRQEIMWGAGYRIHQGRIGNTGFMTFDPGERTDQLFSFFVQDQIALLPDRFHLIVGSKFEENDYTGWEIQPNLRLLWTPDARHTLWAAVSRAVRTPSRFERDFQITQPVPGSPGATFQWSGSDAFESEKLMAYEGGYRFLPGRTLSVDLALFFNRYDDLRTYRDHPPYLEGMPPQLVIPTTLVNGMSGDAYGVELSLDWRPVAWWRLQAAYSWLQMDLDDASTDDSFSTVTEGDSPEQQFSLRSGVDLSHGLELDVWIRYVDELSAETQNISSYWTMDARIGWRVNSSWELALVGQNLFLSRHPEFVSEVLGIWPAEIERSIYGKAIWRF